MTPLPTHRAVALGTFRSSVFFVVAAAAFSEPDTHTRTILLTLIFLLDVATWHLSQVVVWASDSNYNKVWHDILSERFFFEKLIERFRAQEHVDVPELYKEGTVAAREDMKTFLRDNTVWFDWGWFKKTAVGAGHFIWFWISYGIFYSLAGAVGSLARL